MINKTRGLQLIVLILIVFFVGYYFGTLKTSLDWKNYKPILSVSGNQPPPGVSVNFSNFWSVWEEINNKYYDKSKINPEKMMTGAINGMIQTLGDPFTVYLPPVNNKDFKQSMAGEFQGIGAELGTRENKIIVISPLSDSPAIKAGLKPEDTILRVDGESTTGWTLTQAVDKIRGPKGSTVTLAIQSKDSKSSKDVKIVRDTITVKSIDGFVKKIKDIPKLDVGKFKGNENDEIMYLKLSQFGDNTNREWVDLVNQLNLKAVDNPNFKGVVFDLRNNPGGYLNDAAFIASEFLKKGIPVVIQEDSGGERKTMYVERQGLLLSASLVILINKGSASASEIVAGALKDQGRAKLIGETSFGKGTIQEANDLGGGAGVHVTVAKWLTPKGIWVNGKGLEPDVKIALDEKNLTIDTQLEKAIEELLK